MTKFNKVYNLKLTLLLVAIALFLNSAVYGAGLPFNAYLRVPIAKDNYELMREVINKYSEAKPKEAQIEPESLAWKNWFSKLGIAPNEEGYRYIENNYDIYIRVINLSQYKNSNFLREKGVRVFLLIRVWLDGKPVGFVVLYPEIGKGYCLEMVQKKQRKFLGKGKYAYTYISWPASVENIISAIKKDSDELRLVERDVQFHPVTFAQLERYIGHVYYDGEHQRGVVPIEAFHNIFTSLRQMSPKLSLRSLERHIVEKMGYSGLSRISQVYPIYLATGDWAFKRYIELREENGMSIMLAFDKVLHELGEKADQNLQQYVKPVNLQGLLGFFGVNEVMHIASCYELWQVTKKIDYDVLQKTEEMDMSYKKIIIELENMFKNVFSGNELKDILKLVTYKNLESLTTFLKTEPRDKGTPLIIKVAEFKAIYERLKLKYPLNPSIEVLAKELGVNWQTVYYFLKRFPEIYRQYPTQGSNRYTIITVEEIEKVLWDYIERSTGEKIPLLSRDSYLSSLNRAYLPRARDLAEVLEVSRGTINNFARYYPERIRTRETGRVGNISSKVDLDKLKQSILDTNI